MACRTSASQTKSTGCGVGAGGVGGSGAGDACAPLPVSQLYPPEPCAVPCDGPRLARMRSTTSAATLARVDSFVGAGGEQRPEAPLAPVEDPAVTPMPREAR